MENFDKSIADVKAAKAKQNSVTSERPPWDAGNGRYNVLLYEGEYGLEHYTTIGICLDTSTCSEDMVLKNCDIIDKYGHNMWQYKNPNRSFDDVSHVQDIKNYESLACVDADHCGQTFACSVKVNKNGKIDWSSVGKSTIHPDVLSDDDIVRSFDNFALAHQAVEQRKTAERQANGQYLPWEIKDGRINLIVKEKCEFDRPSIQACLDTTAMSTADIDANWQAVCKNGGFPETSYAKFGTFEDNVGTVYDSLPFHKANNATYYACSAAYDKYGNIDWSSVGKSTIHPETLTECDVLCELDNAVIAYGFNELAMRQSRIDEMQTKVNMSKKNLLMNGLAAMVHDDTDLFETDDEFSL